MTYYLNSVFVWRISTGAVKPNSTNASFEVYMTTKGDQELIITEITTDCYITTAPVDATSGIHNINIKYTPTNDPNIQKFIVVCRNTDNSTDHFVLNGMPNTERKYETGIKFVMLS